MAVDQPNRRRAPGCPELLRHFAGQAEPAERGKIRFDGVGDRDVYNIAAPFHFQGEILIAGRVEPRDSENATILLFRRDGDGVWRPRPGAPEFEGLQDPCIAIISGELVLGGVRYPIALADGRTIWRMDFYRGRSIERMDHFLTGPDGMKDIRLGELADGRIALFSRPHCGPGSRGRIGFTIVDRLKDLNAGIISKAPILDGQFTETEWGGVNEVHLLVDGTLGLLGHIAWMEAGEIRHYYAMAFTLDPMTAAPSPVRIIATRAQFPAGPAKRPDLTDVIFAGGLIRHWDGEATLFAGLSDAEAGYARIADPFAAGAAGPNDPGPG